MITFRIPLNGLKTSTNLFYVGTHWSKRKELKDSILSYARVFCKKSRAIERWPVSIRYRFIFETRPLDTLNTAILAKMFEDSLCTLEILPDDSPQYVAESILEVIKQGPGKSSPADKKAPKTRPKAKEDWLEIFIIPYEFKPDN